MTIELFMFLFTVGSTVSSLLTEAIKKMKVKWVSANMIALIDAVIVGVGGTLGAYVLLDVTMDGKNMICVALMTICIWVGSMVGYDKVIQTISQVKRG